MNEVLSGVFIRVYFLPLLTLFCSLSSADGQALFLQAIGNESVSIHGEEVQLKINASEKETIYLIQNESLLLDSLNAAGSECKFTFPICNLQIGDNILQVTEKSPGLCRMSKVTIRVTQERVESDETLMEPFVERSSKSAMVYPNPTTSSFIVNSEELVEKLEIYSPSGEISMVITEKSKEEILIKELPEGIYTIRIFSPHNVKETKLIKY